MNNFLANFKFKVLVNLRRVIYVTLGSLSAVQPKNASVVIFCYHAVGCDDWRFSIDLKTLKKQVKYLLSKYEPMSLEDLEKVVDGKKTVDKPSFVLTFDDGYKDVICVRDYFKKLGIKPAMFVLADTLNANREELDNQRPFLTKREIMAFYKAGWTIGCHSASHSNLTNFKGERLRQEIVGAKRKLERDLGIKVNYFSYPKGNYSRQVVKLVREAGYTMGLSMDDGFIFAGIDPYTVPRVGVDRTHTFGEFKSIFLPFSIMFRKFVRQKVGVLI